MARQLSYKQLFRVGDIVEVAQAPRDGETSLTWIPGKVIKITTRLHVKHGGPGHFAYERSMYNRGEIRKAAIASQVSTDPLTIKCEESGCGALPDEPCTTSSSGRVAMVPTHAKREHAAANARNATVRK